MTLFDLLEYVNDALFVGLAGVCYLQWRRQGGRAKAWLALSFGTLGGAVIVALAVSANPTGAAAQWMAKALLAIIVLFPYLLFRFTASLDRAARWTEAVVGTLAGAVVAWTLALPTLPAEGEPLPRWLRAYLIAILVEWTTVSLIVSGKLWWAGRGQPTAARRRTRALSLAAMGLSLTLVVSGLAPPERTGPLAVAIRIFTLASALLFYLAFAPPRMLRNAWLQPEQETLRRAMNDLMAVTRAEDVAACLLPHVMSMVGGRGAALVDGSGRLLGTDGQTPGLKDGMLVAQAGSKADVQVPDVVRLPLAAGELLVWASPYAPVFGRCSRRRATWRN
jgi:hypothetical protein